MCSRANSLTERKEICIIKTRSYILNGSACAGERDKFEFMPAFSGRVRPALCRSGVWKIETPGIKRLRRDPIVKGERNMPQYTQKAILCTFQDMLQKTPFDKITVSALVSKCEISSNTFYYHYRDIYDLLDTWLQVLKKKYLSELPQDLCWQDTLRELLRTLLRDMKTNSDLVYHLLSSLSRERIEQYIFESTDDTFYQLVCQATGCAAVPEEILRDITEYNSYSFLGFFLKFLWSGMKENVDLEAERISRIFEGNLQWVIEKYRDQ